MSEKKRIPISYIFAGIAAVVCIFWIYEGFFFSIKYISEMRELTFYDVFIPFNNSLYFLILFYLTIGVFLYRRDTVAVPIVLISYLLLDISFKIEALFELEYIHLLPLIDFFITLLTIILSVIWLLKPHKFRYLALLYILYIVYSMYISFSSLAYGWATFFLNFSPVLVFIAVVVKCIDSKETEWMYYRKTYYYWIPGVILVIIYIICYFISLRVSPGI